MNMWDLFSAGARSIAVIGMAKNVGKTVTLNRLIHDANERKRYLGLTSIGRDGEEYDVVSGEEKPSITALPGTLLATTDQCLFQSQARAEVLETTRHNTSMGQVIIVRVRQQGRIQLAGPADNTSLVDVCHRMLKHGADSVLVDGALDRKASASPAVTEAGVLVTGAALARDMDQVVEATAHQASLFNLPAFTPGSAGLRMEHVEGSSGDSLTDMLTALTEKQAVGIINEEGSVRKLDIPTFLGSGAEVGRQIQKKDQAILVRGSVTETAVNEMLDTAEAVEQLTVVVEDATRIFVTPRQWRIWSKRNLRLRVVKQISLMMVTVNPWSPGGWFFDGERFVDRIRQAVHPVPAVNVMGREDQV